MSLLNLGDCGILVLRLKFLPIRWWEDLESGKLIGIWDDMGVSKNRGTPKSSILIGLSIINHPFWGTPIFGNTHILES